MLSFGATLWFLEMSLVLPGPLFQIVAMVINLPQPTLLSPAQIDMQLGRTLAAIEQLQQLVDAGIRHNHPMIVCVTVLQLLKRAETEGPRFQGNLSNFSKEELIRLIGKSNTVTEFWYWMLRLITFVSLLFVLYFFIFH